MAGSMIGTSGLPKDAAVRGRHCMAGDVRIHYLEFGSSSAGTPLLLLPGITSPAATWAFVAGRLAGARRVVVPDIRGRGLSECRPGLGYTLDDYADDAQAVIAAAGLGRPAILGHSMGARIAAHLEARHPGTCATLILADPPLSGPGREAYPTPLESYLAAREAACRGAGIDDLRRFSPTWTDDQIALRLQWLPTCAVEAIVETHRNFHDEDIFASFPKIACPALLIHAARAKVVPSEMAARIVAMMPNGRAEAVDAGHMIPWDNLEDFLQVVERFLA